MEMLIAQASAADAAGAAAGIMMMLLVVAIPLAPMIIGMWGVFEKAGEEGWKALIPIYNLWVLVEISGKGALWFVLMLVPVVNVLASIIVHIELAEQFGKGTAYKVGLIFLAPIFYLLLAFGDAQYQGGQMGAGAPAEAL